MGPAPETRGRHGSAPRNTPNDGKVGRAKLVASSGSSGPAPRAALRGPSFWSPFWLPFLAGLIVPYRSAARPEPIPPEASDADGAAEAQTRQARYLVIVAQGETALCQHLGRQFAGDAAVRVF